ncbi:hypothetical protein C8J30_101268 [Rhodobacter viridis]|uniref:Uncharacterized protein n=1 Tax=Rhodobacter viridis TaxID=1054202 RepID=A0A318U5N4_9RHOB|nr:hypothetical protein [Rhodobacter viridis]PYF12886.1 hypothetical protein C8J30_101268 [Rhodobacter viridis]
MTALRRLWAEQRLALVAFLVALSLAGFFGGRMISRALFWSDPAHHQQAPEAWMTPDYIARSWHVDVEAVDAILGIEDARKLVDDDRPTLEAIAEKLDVPVADLIAKLDAGLPQTPPRSPQ